jgi:hypothetical protein
VIAVACAVLPAGAAARSETFARATLGTGNGYLLTLDGYEHRVIVSVNRQTASASYTVRGRVTGERIVADLGSLGRVDLKFSKRGPARERRVPRRCEGHYTVQPGIYTGSLNFAGEGDFTPVNADRLKGKVASYEIHCKRRHHHHHGHHHHQGHHSHHGAGVQPIPVFLEVTNSQGEYGTRFNAYRFPFGDRTVTQFDASLSKPLGSVDAYYSAVLPARKEAFSVNAKDHTASVAPPAPFSGTAQVGADANGVPTWTGDLAVELPVIGTVPLTGPAFQPLLFTGRGDSSFAFFVGGRPRGLTPAPAAGPAAALGLPPAPRR